AGTPRGVTGRQRRLDASAQYFLTGVQSIAATPTAGGQHAAHQGEHQCARCLVLHCVSPRSLVLNISNPPAAALFGRNQPRPDCDWRLWASSGFVIAMPVADQFGDAGQYDTV